MQEMSETCQYKSPLPFNFFKYISHRRLRDHRPGTGRAPRPHPYHAFVPENLGPLIHAGFDDLVLDCVARSSFSASEKVLESY